MRRASPALLCLAALAVALSGCGGGKRLYPVEGVLQYEDGSPARELAGGTVSLESVEDLSNAAGEVRKDGTFRIQNPFGVDGTPAGDYRLLVLPPEGADRRSPPVDAKYGRYDTSELTMTVKPEPNKVTVKVARLGKGKRG